MGNKFSEYKSNFHSLFELNKKVEDDLFFETREKERKKYEAIHTEFENFVKIFMEKFKENNYINPKTMNTVKFHAIDFYSSLREIIIISGYAVDKTNLHKDFEEICEKYRIEYGLTDEEEKSLSIIRSIFYTV